MENSIQSFVGLFFVINGSLFLHKCGFNEAEEDGFFLNYPKSHIEVWDEYYYKKYRVDFDYYPRGRVIYRKEDDTFLIYRDKCIPDKLTNKLLAALGNSKYLLLTDEHYVCHECNEVYYC